MIHPSCAAASWFLWIAGAIFLVVYALPLLLAPLAWARWFRWELPRETRLTVYFGRCLGAVAVAIVVVCFRAAPDPRPHRFLFDLIALIGALMTAIHAWGAIRKVQPWTETAEILLYAVLTAAAYGVGRTLGGP